MSRPLSVAILTDKSGPKLVEMLNKESSTWAVAATAICPDVVQDIQKIVTRWADVDRYNVIVTSGGTGFAKRDVTPEAIKVLLDKEAPGLVHAMFDKSFTITPLAAMARLVAGVRKESLVITVPGSPKGAVENLEAILKLLPHASDLVTDAVNSRAVHAKGTKSIEEAAGLTGPPAQDTPTLQEPTEQQSGHTHHPHHHHHHHDHGHKHMSNDPSESVTRRARSSPYPMISVADALALVLEHTPSPITTTIPINGHDCDHAVTGYFVSEDILAREAVPAYRASIVDGYAAVASDGPGTYPVVSVSHANPDGVPGLRSGQIARITTGAPVPAGADTVVMVEDTKLVSTTADGREEREVEILVRPAREANVREPGSDLASGARVMARGERITRTGGEIGVLASAGVSRVPVYGKPVVGVLSTGDELLDPSVETALRPGQIRDSNRVALLSTLQAHHFAGLDLGIAPDSPDALEATLRSALARCDVVVTTGGVSMGELDLLKPTLERTFDGTIHFGRVAMKPGKPTTFATVPKPKSRPGSESGSEAGTAKGDRRTVVFALPGNPASALVTFHLFVLPALLKLSGHATAPDQIAPRIKVVLGHALRLDPRPEFHRVTLAVDRDGRLVGTSTGFQRSSRVASLKCQALLCLPPRTESLTDLDKGDVCDAVAVDWI
ncbi:protein of unknown function [Taphrina deformans PYCC 5710]|uniref:MoaB/Mog domain-containing protein n=1 Tax=Taphrina deformans (strain PYCC 5710 / ATCC 11124 / CBS 356.35 / IMI 108563 / JCM 9778 / NBRC 8474) TaxID=1097556 RepID=R4XDK0_TAPDE|nr:protein of unknown function [Taphrina deformans PYCC 5710]|eukprot:CCG83915.1 protein of unknown function [Taphrina deformans PYCC 5710]